MTSAWYAMNASDVVGIFATTVGLYVVMAVLVRLNGLRSFSEMSAFDFVSTVAVGSLFASTMVTQDPSLLAGSVGLLSLFLVKRVLDIMRGAMGFVQAENTPLLLMDRGSVLEDNLETARVTREELFSKLREANVSDPRLVRAVVLETTGHMSVLHGEGPWHEDLLLGVRGADPSRST